MSNVQAAVGSQGCYRYYGPPECPMDICVTNNSPSPVYFEFSMNSLVPEETVCTADMAPACKKEKDEMSRYYDEELGQYVEGMVPTEEQRSRKYLRNRAQEVWSQKYKGLQKKFGLLDDDGPTGFDEFVARIKDGLFVFEKEKYRDRPYWWDYIRWRNPDTKEDQKGFDAAVDVMQAEFAKVTDAIMVKSASEALDAITEFAAWKLKK